MDRNDLGQFDLKGEEPRNVRSIRLTDTCWDALGEFADSQGISRADLLESWCEDGRFDVSSESQDDRDEILESIREVIESLVPRETEQHLIEVPGSRVKFSREVLTKLLEYLESQ